jgi:multidrug efflux pump subunit AcrB
MHPSVPQAEGGRHAVSEQGDFLRDAGAVRQAPVVAESVWGVLDHPGADFAKLPAAIVLPFNLPPIIGLGSGAGFEYQLSSFAGAQASEMAAVARGLVQAADANPALAGVFTTFGASTPPIRLDIDRERAETLGIGISSVFTAPQAALGGYYVNDFNKFGRAWQVILEAEAAQRMNVDDIFEVDVPAANGTLVPIRTLATVENVLGPGYDSTICGRWRFRRAGTGLFLGSGIGGDGGSVEGDPAAKLRLLVERHRLA